MLTSETLQALIAAIVSAILAILNPTGGEVSQEDILRALQQTPTPVVDPTPTPTPNPAPTRRCDTADEELETFISSVKTFEDAQCLLERRIALFDRERRNGDARYDRAFNGLSDLYEADVHGNFVRDCKAGKISGLRVFGNYSSKKFDGGFWASPWTGPSWFRQQRPTDVVIYDTGPFQHLYLPEYSRNFSGYYGQLFSFQAYCFEVSGPVNAYLQKADINTDPFKPKALGEPIILDEGVHVMWIRDPETHRLPGSATPGSYFVGFTCANGEKTCGAGTLSGALLMEKIP